MSKHNFFREHITSRIAKVSDLPAEQAARVLEIPPDPKLGEYAFPCFLLARQRKSPPPKVASWLASQLLCDDVVEAVTAQGPYVNFRLTASSLASRVLPEIATTQAGYGRSDLAATIVIDFSSPNIAKPLSIGHLRSTVLGNALGRVFRHLGAKVVGINHLGDWGTQFGYLVTGWRRWGSEEELTRDPIRHLFEIYVLANASEDPAIKEEARATFKAMEEGDQPSLALWQRFRSLSLQVFGRFYEDLGVTFESQDGEAFFNDKMEPALALLAEKGLTTVSDGALVYPMGPEKKPALLKKSDGSTLYLTRDLAAALYRLKTYAPDKVLYVVGMPQKEHFRELFTMLAALDPANKDRFVHVDFGQYRFAEGKMSTRSGNVIFLEEVVARGVEMAKVKIEEKNPDLEDRETTARLVALGAIVFGDLVNDRVKDIVFEWEKVLDFEGDTAPYVMFAHVRARGILRKLAEEGVEPDLARLQPGLLGHEHERRLMVALGQFPETLDTVARTLKPHTLATFLLELARTYHRFCHDCPVLKAEPGLKESRLILTHAVATVLSLGLQLLGIRAPDRM
ncbi:MAG: arginine--tRNA ligase [Candidatus Riflebacteria bacterium]|nr:arginine--tRNA ligase [Candidatus Riflebacteria bacterium]